MMTEHLRLLNQPKNWIRTSVFYFYQSSVFPLPLVGVPFREMADIGCLGGNVTSCVSLSSSSKMLQGSILPESCDTRWMDVCWGRGPQTYFTHFAHFIHTESPCPWFLKLPCKSAKMSGILNRKSNSSAGQKPNERWNPPLPRVCVMALQLVSHTTGSKGHISTNSFLMDQMKRPLQS